jgi:hypothetical protein
VDIVWIEILIKGHDGKVVGAPDYDWYERDGQTDQELYDAIEDNMLGRMVDYPAGWGRYMSIEWNFIGRPPIDYINKMLDYYRGAIARNTDIVQMLENII